MNSKLTTSLSAVFFITNGTRVITNISVPKVLLVYDRTRTLLWYDRYTQLFRQFNYINLRTKKRAFSPSRGFCRMRCTSRPSFLRLAPLDFRVDIYTTGIENWGKFQSLAYALQCM